MIAEVNKLCPCDVPIMDATAGFSTGGPERGDLIGPGVMLASADRIALDAVAIALLRLYGSTPDVMQGRIFAMDQIARAVELGIGVRSAEDLRLVALDSESKNLTFGYGGSWTRPGEAARDSVFKQDSEAEGDQDLRRGSAFPRIPG